MSGINGKLIADAVHGYIRLDDMCVSIVDTPHFQRLRNLKQLGTASYVFPCATHSRFEHSLGVCHLAGKHVEQLKSRQPELEISDEDAMCVKIAGLCHDLGHGPYSHVFDNEFIPRVQPGRHWTHEQASEMMLEHLVDTNKIDLDRNMVNFIKDIIQGRPRHFKADGKQFLFDIVANKRSGVDVDKFDYIQRDCYNLGEKSGYDCSRLIEMSRVLDDQICYYHKEVYNIYELFNTRYSLFKRIYTHSVGKAIEYMLVDAMVLADKSLHISACIDDPELYLALTDSIVEKIEFSQNPVSESYRAFIFYV